MGSQWARGEQLAGVDGLPGRRHVGLTGRTVQPADARRLFAKQEPQEKRRLLNFVLSNSTWKNGELSVTFRQPFDLLAQTTAIVTRGNGGSGLNSPGHPGWLGD